MSTPAPVKIPLRVLREHAAIRVSNLLSGLGMVLEYPKGAVLSKQGGSIGAVFVLEEGMVAYQHTLHDGRQSLTGLRKAPWVIGASSLLTQQPLPASIVTLSPCTLAVVPALRFLESWEKEPGLAKTLGELHAWDHDDMMAHAVGLATQNARERLEEFIWEQTAGQPEVKGRYQMPFSLEQQSQWLVVCLSHLNALYQALGNDGLVFRDQGWLRIPDRSLLWRRSVAAGRKPKT